MRKKDTKERKARAEVVAHATEIIARRCCGENVTLIHKDLRSRGAIVSLLHTFSRAVLEMEMNRLSVPHVPTYLKLRGILQKTDIKTPRRLRRNGSSPKAKPFLVPVPVGGTVC